MKLRTIFLIITLLSMSISCRTIIEKLDELFNPSEATSSNTQNNASQETSQWVIVDNRNSSQNSTSRNTTAVPTPRRSYTIPVSYEKAYSYRTDTPDPRMTRIPQSIESQRVNNPDEYINRIVSYINEGAKDDFDRTKKSS